MFLPVQSAPPAPRPAAAARGNPGTPRSRDTCSASRARAACTSCAPSAQRIHTRPRSRLCRAAPSRALASVISRHGTSSGMPSSAGLLPQLGEPRPVLRPIPRIDRASVQRQPLVGNHQVQVEVDRVAESLAARTRAKRIVEAEQPRLRLAPRPMAARALIRAGESQPPSLRSLVTRGLLKNHLARLAIRNLRRIHNARTVLRAHHECDPAAQTPALKIQIEQRLRRRKLEDSSLLIEPVESARAQLGQPRLQRLHMCANRRPSLRPSL